MKGLPQGNSGRQVVKATSWIQENENALAHKEEIKATTKIILRLIDFAEQSGMSQSDLARKLGVTPQYIHKLFHGKENSFRVETAIEYGRILGISLLEVPEEDIMVYMNAPEAVVYPSHTKHKGSIKIMVEKKSQRLKFNKSQIWNRQKEFSFA